MLVLKWIVKKSPQSTRRSTTTVRYQDQARAEFMIWFVAKRVKTEIGQATRMKRSADRSMFKERAVSGWTGKSLEAKRQSIEAAQSGRIKQYVRWQMKDSKDVRQCSKTLSPKGFQLKFRLKEGEEISFQSVFQFLAQEKANERIIKKVKNFKKVVDRR